MATDLSGAQYPSLATPASQMPNDDPNALQVIPGGGSAAPTSSTQLQNFNISDMETPVSYNANVPSTALQTAGSWLQSPLSQALIPTAVGLYGTQQANQNLQNLTNQERGVVQPAVNYGQGVLNQMQGGAPMAGPAGQYVGQQLTNANTLAQAAQPYATGNLTQGQALALQQAAQGASAATNLGYAMSGNPLSSANVAAQQGIADQSIITAGQVQQQNIQFAAQAMQAAQGVYSGILNGALNSSALGLKGYSAAVQQQITGDQQIQQQQQTLFNQIAQGITGASPSGPGGTASSNAWSNLMSKITGGSQPGAVNSSSSNAVNTDTSSNDPSDFNESGGAGTID